MSKIGISQRHQEKVYPYVTQAISLYDPGTTTLRDNNIYKFGRIVYILGNLIDIQGHPYNNDKKRRLISSGIKRFSQYRIKSFRLFLRALETEIRQMERRTLSKFFVVFPWNLSYESLQRKRHFILAKTRLKTYPSTYVYRHFDFARPYHLLSDRRRGIRGSTHDFTFITVEIYARNENDAFKIAEQRVELLRSLFNFVLSYGKVTWQMGRPSPLALIDPPRYMFTFNEKKQFLNYWFNVGPHEYRLLRLRHNELERIKKAAARFEKLRNNKLKDVLIDCLKLYDYALDQIERGYIFLNLWQILELISLKESNGISLDKARNRIKAIFRNNPVVSDVLNAVFRKRNRLVHQGKLANFSLEDVNQIKGIAEASINFLFSHVNKLKTKDNLRSFYENLNINNTKLDKKIGVLKYVKKIHA